MLIFLLKQLKISSQVQIFCFVGFPGLARHKQEKQAHVFSICLDTSKYTITKYLKPFKIVLENFRNLYFKEAFSDNPQVKRTNETGS